MPRTENLGNFPQLVKSWILEENLKLPLYNTGVIPNYVLNICSYSRVKYRPHPLSIKLPFAIDKDH